MSLNHNDITIRVVVVVMLATPSFYAIFQANGRTTTRGNDYDY